MTIRAEDPRTTGTMPAEPASSVRSATVWSYGLTIGRLGITTALSFVLAAMLGPRAFGVIAMALVFINLIEMLQQQGLMPAIISRGELRGEHADTAFWLVVGVGLACTGLGLGLAPLWADVNALPELALVIQVLALGVPLTSSVVVHEAILRRRLEFRKLAIRSWVSVLTGGAAGIGAAVAGWGVWALVVQQLVMNATVVAVLWRVTPWRPRFRFSLTAAKELWSYSLRSTASSVGLFLGARLDILLAGAFFGPVVVGLYRLAQRLTTMVVDLTARAMQGVSLPGLAAVQSEPQRFAVRLLKMQRLTATLALPALALVVGLAPVVEAVLGPEWHGTTSAIQILAAAQAFTAVSLLLGPALQAIGRPGTLALLIWLWAGLTVAALVVAVRMTSADDSDRLVALCLAVAIASAVAVTVMVVVTSSIFSIPITDMAAAWLPGAVAAVGIAAVTTMMMQFSISMPIKSVMGLVSGMAVGMALLALLDRRIRALIKQPKELINLI